MNSAVLFCFIMISLIHKEKDLAFSGTEHEKDVKMTHSPLSDARHPYAPSLPLQNGNAGSIAS